MAEVRLLLGPPQPLAPLRLGFLLALGRLGGGTGARPLGLALGDPLGLTLLVRSGFRLRLGLGLGRLLRLLALDLRVLGRVPRV